MNLPVIPADKANHAIYGAFITLVGLLVNPIVAAALCVLLAVGKEVYDRKHGGTVDPMDVVATAAGGVTVIAASLL
jgi:uncharacterized membrane protein YhiD involved in acid resistance